MKTAAAAFQAVGLEKHASVVKEATAFKKASVLVGANTDKKAITMCIAYRKKAKRVRPPPSAPRAPHF